MNKKDFTIEDIFGDGLSLSLNESDKVAGDVHEQVDIKKKPKLVKVTEEGIVILDDNLMKKVKAKNLSASMVSSVEQCPADWLMDSFILPKIDHEEPIYFVKGKIFHDTMEAFFTLPKEKRNPNTLSQLAMKVIKSDFKDSLEDPETMSWIRDALKGYLETGFPYEDVNVAQIVKKAGRAPELGVELFVKGKLGNTTRQVVGFVDRIDELPDGSLQVVDYKSGGKIQPFDPDKEIGEGNDFSYWRQQLAYSMLLEQDGHNVGGAILEFPVARGTVEVDVNNQELKKRVEEDFEKVDRNLNKYIEENLFPFKGHFFCKWCGMLNPNYTTSRFGHLNVSWEDVNQFVEYLE